MSLDTHNNPGQSSSNNNGDRSNMNSNENPLFALLSQPNLTSSTHNISEVKDINKNLEDTIEYLQKNTASEPQKKALPSLVQNITSDISPQLPGITLSTVIGSTRYVQPVLFWKTGVTEQTEIIVLANEAMPRGIAKVPASFMNLELMEKIKTAYTFHEGRTMTNVFIVAPLVINLEAYLKNSVKYEDMITDVRTVILKEWNTGLLNMIVLDVTKAGVKFPSPFKDGMVFGKDSSAVARIEPVNGAVIDGRPVPYNLAVKLSTTNKNNTQNPNSNNTRSVCTNYLTVALEGMNQQQFMEARQRRPGAVVGPLVPVISTGITIPGETLNSNNSMITALLGLYAGIGANQPQFFSEAIRGKQVGHRGNIGNFNHYLASMLGQSYSTANFITDKNITNAAVVNSWLSTYVAPNAVYVLDLATYTEDVSNSDFWWNVVGKSASSTYHKALINVLDALSNNEFSNIIKFNADKGNARDPRRDWVAGDAILKPTPILLPSGIARGKDGKWFDLAEVDGMFLRGENYHGQNEAAVNQYLSLICGSQGGDVKVRQFNIYNHLNQLFDTNVIIEGWKRRYVWEDSFFNTMARAMGSAGSLSMSASSMASMWTMQSSNEYLNNIISTVLNSGMQSGNMNGMNGSFTHY